MIRWSRAARKKARAGRRDETPRTAREQLDTALAREAITTFFAGQAQRWADGQPAADPIRARLMDAVCLSFSSSDWTPTDPDVEGARAAMVTDWQHKQEDVVSDWLVPLWATTRGVMFAFSSLLQAAALRMQWHTRAGKEAGWYLVHKAPDFGPMVDHLRGWGALREELGRTAWTSYRNAVEHAASVRASAPLALRCALSYAFATEHRWTFEDAKACLTAEKFPAFGARLLSIDDADLSVQVARACSTWALETEYLYTLVDAVGERAVDPLEVLLERCASEGSTRRAKVAGALSLIQTDAAASVLARHAEDPEIQHALENDASESPLSDDVLEEIRHQVVQGFDNREVMFDWILSAHPRQLGMDQQEYEVLVGHAIKDALAAKAKEMETWPSLTDCDRLRVAFDALDKQGIVALENPGLTQTDSIPYAASIAVVRDELAGDGETHGYCFFTWNDMTRAIDGDGLSLAYGTFNEEPPPPPPAPPTRCEICDGRGWIPAIDAAQFPTPCSCRSASTVVAPVPTPPPTLGQKVGAAVLQACRDAGLGAEWNGQPEAFVELPKFRWQRRLVVTHESDIRNFLESWELEIRAGYTAANEMLEAMEVRAADWFETFSDFGPELRERLHAHTERFIQEEHLRESQWTEPTINDRITGAFEELNGQGVLASECLGLTIQDGWGYSGIQASPEHRGVAFFHHEDVIDAMSGIGLLVAFGAIGVEAGEDDIATAALARQIASALERNGVRSSWSGSIRERIRIEPFEWRKRRWTVAPAYERVEVVPEVSKRPSFLSRILRGNATSPSKPDEVAGNVSALKCGAVVRAVRDENGFDVRRARQMRAAWKALGNKGEAQVGHVGIPHVFVPALEFTSMAPQLANLNLREEKNEILGRGARSKAAPEGTDNT
jgi:hypothetical protein